MGFYCLVQIMLFLSLCQTQQLTIVLDQGLLKGFKIFPGSTRTAVYTFLGVPYAQAPLGEFRFASPQPHIGWDNTYQAMKIKPICPQLINTIYDETVDGTLARPESMEEDCLYLNIWVPDVDMSLNKLPVLVIISGEEMLYDWPRNRVTGLDIALEGVIVVTIQYRQNIFGWINLGIKDLSGNYGLQDQELALQWVRNNIGKFGGNAEEVTLLGHGTSGAPCAIALAVMQPSKTGLFSKLILMSGGDFEASLLTNGSVLMASESIIEKLGCHFEKHDNLIAFCLRNKSVSDLQKAFESIYDHGNGSLRLGPTLPNYVLELFKNQNHHTFSLPPILIGITSNEGAFFQDYWFDLARQGYESVRRYVNFTILPKMLKTNPSHAGLNLIAETMDWQYFSGKAESSVTYLLYSMQRIISESQFEVPFYYFLELLLSDKFTKFHPIYAYILHLSESMDMRGKVNLFGGASHSSDLPLLLGPSLFQQISRRRLNPKEENICRNMRNLFMNFVKSGNPKPNRVHDVWMPYSKHNRFIYSIEDDIKKVGESTSNGLAQFLGNFQLIENLIEESKLKTTYMELMRPNPNGLNIPNKFTVDKSISENRKKVSSYLASQNNDYFPHLKHSYKFWKVLIPEIDTCDRFDTLKRSFNQRIQFVEISADAARYKKGFFIMLGLFAVLLAVLGLCIHLLNSSGSCL